VCGNCIEICFGLYTAAKNEYRLAGTNGQLYLKLFCRCQMWKTGIYYFSIGNGSIRIALTC
ncbi:MAG TPA: hypothetical protein VEL11_09145, partial [Candidatus Bathyarchaeia archaeon]|nr:hypothetical protein [Candidatus Bathyarchaeia archaeon]